MWWPGTESNRRRQAGLIRGHRIEGVAAGDDPGDQRDLLSGQPVGVPRAVKALVMRANDLAHLTQQPAATVPCGFTVAGLPVGLQIVGPRHADALVLRAARAYEAARMHPTLSPSR